MRFTEFTERLEALNRKLSGRAIGNRLRRDLIRLIMQYEKDLEIEWKALHNSRNRQ
jgi:hypothetical protein